MSNVLLEQRGSVAIITISREKSLNALNTETVLELRSVVDSVAADAGVRAVIVTGAGSRAFVAGADIEEMSRLTPEESLRFSYDGSGAFRAIEIMNKPVIAAVAGFALGGGCELAMACDIRIAAENAKFAQPEVSLGITPGYGGTQRLARLVGVAKAKELIFTCERIDAAEALRIGLVNRVVPVDELMPAALALAEKLAAMPATALTQAKLDINRGSEIHIDSALELESQAFTLCFAAPDRAERMSAFLKKK